MVAQSREVVLDQRMIDDRDALHARELVAVTIHQEVRLADLELGQLDVDVLLETTAVSVDSPTSAFRSMRIRTGSPARRR